MATAPRASTTTGGLARWPTPAPAPACLTPATPGVKGSGRLTAALRQSRRPRLRQPLPHRADRYVRQLMAHLTCATRNSQSAICAYCNQAVPICWLQSVTVTYPELHLVRAGVEHRHHAPRCARWYPPAARSRLSAPTGANRTSSLAPRQRSGRSTSRDTERRISPDGHRQQSSRSVTAIWECERPDRRLGALGRRFSLCCEHAQIMCFCAGDAVPQTFTAVGSTGDFDGLWSRKCCVAESARIEDWRRRRAVPDVHPASCPSRSPLGGPHPCRRSP